MSETGNVVIYCLPVPVPSDEVRGGQEKKQHEEGRNLLSYALKNEFNIDFSEVMIKFGEHGKPMLKGGFPHFNISHCKGMVVCALADCPVGVDIEGKRNITEPLLKKVCGEEELFYVKRGAGLEKFPFWKENEQKRTNVLLSDNSVSEGQILNFLKIWTLKESFLKMTGKGITTDLKDVGFRMEDDGEIRCNQGGFYEQKILKEGYILSVCTEKSVKDIIVKYKNENIENSKKQEILKEN